MREEQGFIQFWQQTDFSKYNEADIREEFIAKLLYLLGYSKNTINDIVREKTLKLSEPFQRVGRKRMNIDYVPTVRLKSFWILEAKPGHPKQMDIGDMLQAYLYATHPEIQVPYIVLCNGWELKIFYIHQIENWKEPIFTIDSTNCAEKFSELREILSADSILDFQRKRLLEQIKNTFEVEIDIKKLRFFKTGFMKMESDLEKKIRKNEKQLWRDNFEKNRAAADAEVREADEKTLLIWMDSLANSTNKVVFEYYRRIVDSTPDEREKKLRKLMQTYLGRCHTTFKCNCMYIFMLVVLNNLKVEDSVFMKEPKEELEIIIRRNLKYWEENDLQNALCFLDRICCKFAAIVIKNGMIDQLSKEVQERKKYLSVEEKICGNGSSVAKLTVPWIWTFAELLWLNFSRLNSAEEVWEAIEFLNTTIVTMLEQQSIKKYPDNDADLLGYEYYGDNGDLLVNGTCNILREHNALQIINVDEEIKRIIVSDYPERKEFIPKLKKLDKLLEAKQAEKYMKLVYNALLRTIELMAEKNKMN